MLKKLAAAAAALVMLAGCSSSAFGMAATENAARIEAENAGKDSAASGTMIVGEGQIVVICPDLEKGEVNIMFKDATGNIELTEALMGEAVISHDVAPGEYTVSAAVTEKATGEIKIVIVDKGRFNEADFDPDDYLEAAGIKKD